MNHLVYATGKFLPNIGRIMAGSVIWTVNLKLLLKYQKKELSYLQIPEMKQFSSNLPDSRYIFHGSVFEQIIFVNCIWFFSVRKNFIELNGFLWELRKCSSAFFANNSPMKILLNLQHTQCNIHFYSMSIFPLKKMRNA